MLACRSRYAERSERELVEIGFVYRSAFFIIDFLKRHNYVNSMDNFLLECPHVDINDEPQVDETLEVIMERHNSSKKFSEFLILQSISASLGLLIKPGHCSTAMIIEFASSY